MVNGGGDRAAIFDDEKRRIIDSCFSKREEDDSIHETYITHIRITEYANHPTTPPPPQARTPQSEKPRIIIVAVRKSGRVRVHKSKENPNGTFSIGKTWNLDDLSAIESFTGPTASPSCRQWAGMIGFVVTLGKPYYWQAQTDKEKKFFIASLIKIYGKYTGGRIPALTGFDQRELDQVLGGAQANRRLERPPAVLRPAVAMEATSSSNSISSTYQSALATQTRQKTPPPPRERSPSRGPRIGDGLPPNGSDSPSRRLEPTLSTSIAPLRQAAASNKSQESVAATMATAKSDKAAPGPKSRNGGQGDVFATAESRKSATPPPITVESTPPERRRPPMDPLRPAVGDDDLVPAPLTSPHHRRDPMVPSRNAERMSARNNSMTRRGPPVVLPPTPSLTDRTVTPQPEPRKQEAPPTGPSPAAAGTPISLGSVESPPCSETAADSPVDDESRPGLGPMIKTKRSKGDIAGKFRAMATAASAFNSFKPRAGGAGERLRLNQNKTSNEPDGVTSVVPAPPRPSRPSSSHKTAEPASGTAIPERPPKAADRTRTPEVRVSGSKTSSRPSSQQGPAQDEVNKAAEAGGTDDARRTSSVAGNDIKYLSTLGIDPTILDKRSAEFARWLDFFGWVPGQQMRAKNLDEMKAEVEREISKAQAGGWLVRFQEEDERVKAIKRGIALAMNECDEVDNLLTLYSVELSTLSDDIAYIEAQGQGLQVQAANQKLLKKELESLLETCAISEADLAALRRASLENASGVEEIESSLVTLYRAMLKMDPSMGSGESGKSMDDASDQPSGRNSDYGKMRIVQEKREMYMAESNSFMRRLVDFMARRFDDAFRTTRAALDGALSKKVDARNHEAGRDMLWMYSPLILYARDVDLQNWNRIMQLYQDRASPVYRAEFRDAMEAWKKNARKATGDEAELLFTSLQEKKEEGIATTARKLTVKRSQTLARTLRSPLGDGGRNQDKSAAADARPLPYEVFAGVMDDLLPLVEMEQNFVVDFFHATTLEQMDFPDAVAASRPRERHGGDLRRHRLMEPDRELARRVTRAMEGIFAFLEQGVQLMVDFVLNVDPLQGAGVLATLERRMADMGQSNQDFLNNVLQKLHGNLDGRFTKFVDKQIRAIEETKVKIKKRKGVIGFMRIFPQFSAAVESMLSGAGADALPGIRRTIDREYDRILKSTFDSLKVIARETPAVAGGAAVASSLMGTASSADPEDKEALNFHIMLIENMNHYLEEVDNPKALEVLENWRAAAQGELAEHVGLYVKAVLRRPLGRLLDHLENIEAQLAGGKTPSAVAAQPSNAKAIFNKVLGAYDAKEVRKGIETLRKRVEKHFSGSDDDDDASIVSAGRFGGAFGGGGGNSGAGKNSLVTRVLRECEKFYGEVEMRIGRITTDVYGGDVLFEWPRAEVKSAFSGLGR